MNVGGKKYKTVQPCEKGQTKVWSFLLFEDIGGIFLLKFISVSSLMNWVLSESDWRGGWDFSEWSMLMLLWDRGAACVLLTGVHWSYSFLHLSQLWTTPCSCCRTLITPQSRGPVAASDRFVLCSLEWTTDNGGPSQSFFASMCVVHSRCVCVFSCPE